MTRRPRRSPRTPQGADPPPRWGWMICLLAIAAATGCGPPANTQRLRQQVLQVDPGFVEALEKRDEQANRIKLLEREYDLKRTQVERQMVQLRNDLKTSRLQVNEKTQKIKALLKPNWERLDLALAMATEERKAERTHRASLGRSLSQLRKALRQPNAQWAEPERARMAKEQEDLLQEIQRLDQELAALNQHIRILEMKRLLLRL